MIIKLKHLRFPSPIEGILKRAWRRVPNDAETYNLIDFEWTLHEFFNEVSPVEIYICAKGLGKYRLRRLIAFFLDIDETSTIEWLKQCPNMYDMHTYHVKKLLNYTKERELYD